EHLDGLGQDELDADLGHDPTPAAVERLDRVAGEDLVAGQGVLDQRALLGQAARSPIVAPSWRRLCSWRSSPASRTTPPSRGRPIALAATRARARSSSAGCCASQSARV